MFKHNTHNPKAWRLLKYGPIPFFSKIGIDSRRLRAKWYDFETHVLNRYYGIYFIHIGKCGGSTLTRLLRNHCRDQHIITAHCAKPVWHPNFQYITCVRSPLSRFISSFNWRLREIKDGLEHEQREVQEYNFFKTPNNLAEALSDDTLRNRALFFLKSRQDRNNHPEHIQMGINWYLEDIIDKPGFLDNVIVIRQEFLLEDINKNAKLLGLRDNLPITHARVNKIPDLSANELSPVAVRNLIQYYKKDYDVLQALSSSGRLDDTYCAQCKKYPYRHEK